jgi:hypothetical protein
MLSIFIFTLMLNNGFLLYHITMASMQAIQYGHTGSEKFIISLLISRFPCSAIVTIDPFTNF